MAEEAVVVNPYVPKNWSESNQTSSSTSSYSSTTKKTLDAKLVQQIMSGLIAQMTDKEIEAYAEKLLRPQLNAELEAAQQQYDATELGKTQEIENLAAALARSIVEQQSANAKSRAGLETAALARGMGRSSYTLQTLANQDNILAETIRQLTEETSRQQDQIQKQITLAAQQNAQTQGRAKQDYASKLAAKIQELRNEQNAQYNQNYMTAVSAAMGSTTSGTQTGSSTGSSLNISGEFGDGGTYVSSGATSTGVAKPSTTITVGQPT